MSNVIPESVAEQIIARKIEEWNNKRKLLKQNQTKVHHFIAITRDFGCREEEIIPRLEETLGWKVYGKNLLNHIAEREELSRNFLETLDEKKTDPDGRLGQPSDSFRIGFAKRLCFADYPINGSYCEK